MNYFEFYKLPVSFLLEEKLVKEKYLILSRKFHPDFFTGASAEKQREILALSTENNKAFQTLKNFDRRMKYILMEKGFLVEEEKYSLAQLFLMEMMDLNEGIMAIDDDPSKKDEIIVQLSQIEDELYSAVLPLLSAYNENTAVETDYLTIKEYYYKRKYLLRIREQLDKFASP
ncbi:MAG: Fe-S protein assembly co-chaperone HscB [Chitinophagales bacterium]